MSGLSPELRVWAVALEFLSEAERSPAAAFPRMATHAAYYAMFHAARAVLLKVEGQRAPTKHSAVVSRFGYHARQANDPVLRAAGKALNAVQEERLRSDYDTARRPQPAEAAEAVREARGFIETCARLHGFPPP